MNMKSLSNFRTYYFFFSVGFFLLSQSTLNLTYAQDVVVIIDDIESRLNVSKDLYSAQLNIHSNDLKEKDDLKNIQLFARRKDEIA